MEALQLLESTLYCGIQLKFYRIRYYFDATEGGAMDFTCLGGKLIQVTRGYSIASHSGRVPSGVISESNMDRSSLVLAVLSLANGGEFSPVQVQKLFFLVDKNISEYVEGPHFSFEPYDYGPFDKAMYQVIDELQTRGLVEICPVEDYRWCNYRLTEAGQKEGEEAFSKLPEKVMRYLRDLVKVVRSLSFTELVSAIYKAYPEMKVNSVFRE